VGQAEENLRGALAASMADQSVETRLGNLEFHSSFLEKMLEEQNKILAKQNEVLHSIQESTAGLVEAWNTATHTWKFVVFVNKGAKVCAQLILAGGIFWGVFTHATVENFKKAMELFK
jgi:uncharacterized coiled-coil protein SlyX